VNQGGLRKLATHSAVYGAADVFQSAVNFLLIPLYVGFLDATAYGNLALLLLFGTLAKIVFRMGLDAGFFRVHYDQEDAPSRQALAGTVTVFAAAVGAVLLAATVLLAPLITRLLFSHDLAPTRWVVLVAADVAVGTLAFVPLALLRIEDRPVRFSIYSGVRHSLNIALKVLLLWRGLGVDGALWADLVSTAVFVVALLPLLRGRARPAWRSDLLGEALGFGLPKVPHGLMVQAQNLADRKILDLFVSRAEVGIYSFGYQFGAGVKFALSAFEPAWGPYVYSRVREPGAPRVLARTATHAFAAFVALALAVGLLAPEAITVMTTRRPEFRAATPVVPMVSLAYLLHGVFLLTSIGIGIERRARYYPLVTAAAAAVNIGANFAWVPSHGMIGAAWATVASYAVMAGLGGAFSRRLYPIPFEAARMIGMVGLAGLAYAAGRWAPEALWASVAFKSALLAAFASAAFVIARRPRRDAPEGLTPAATSR
jgi:O-antigen/teichoic acid export membrane protein